jgi:hypothetical protein
VVFKSIHDAFISEKLTFLGNLQGNFEKPKGPSDVSKNLWAAVKSSPNRFVSFLTNLTLGIIFLLICPPLSIMFFVCATINLALCVNSTLANFRKLTHEEVAHIGKMHDVEIDENFSGTREELVKHILQKQNELKQEGLRQKELEQKKLLESDV